MEAKPDTIKVSAYSRAEVPASHADLFVTVRGSSVFSGNEAMKKAREVSQLVDELTRFGLPPANIQLQGVHIESSGGALLKTSSAIYRLRVRSDKLDQIPELIDIFAAQKNAAVERIDWKYPEEAAYEAALEAAIARAKARAGKVAETMGVRLLGVYDFMENVYDQEPPMPFRQEAGLMKARMADSAEPALGMDIQHSKTVQVNVEIWYRVSEFD